MSVMGWTQLDERPMSPIYFAIRVLNQLVFACRDKYHQLLVPFACRMSVLMVLDVI